MQTRLLNRRVYGSTDGKRSDDSGETSAQLKHTKDALRETTRALKMVREHLSEVPPNTRWRIQGLIEEVSVLGDPSAFERLSGSSKRAVKIVRGAFDSAPWLATLIELIVELLRCAMSYATRCIEVMEGQTTWKDFATCFLQFFVAGLLRLLYRIPELFAKYSLWGTTVSSTFLNDLYNRYFPIILRGMRHLGALGTLVVILIEFHARNSGKGKVFDDAGLFAGVQKLSDAVWKIKDVFTTRGAFKELEIDPALKALANSLLRICATLIAPHLMHTYRLYEASMKKNDQDLNQAHMLMFQISLVVRLVCGNEQEQTDSQIRQIDYTPVCSPLAVVLHSPLAYALFKPLLTINTAKNQGCADFVDEL